MEIEKRSRKKEKRKKKEDGDMKRGPLELEAKIESAVSELLADEASLNGNEIEFLASILCTRRGGVERLVEIIAWFLNKLRKC
ncbi:hypothetical protein CEXT_375261 [Caerostris extrusa]|uniref:Uncharacterized protein n=1 Tax=Caerostris extrusa TaxID=172846 RepID=A0AAV4SZQ2_CAEEX|nr:hypothetical protein CEXT_375261 [Caerostris extrusa]